MTVYINIPGKPVPKGRPRFTKSGRTYTDPATVAYEKTVAQYAALEIKEPFTGPIDVSISVTFEMPKSWTKKKRDAMLYGYHTQTPDLDNVLKAITDGMNGVAFVDDAQIAELSGMKRWGRKAGVLISVRRI